MSSQAPPLTWNPKGIVETVNGTTINQNVPLSGASASWRLGRLEAAGEQLLEVRMMGSGFDGRPPTTFDVVFQVELYTYTRIGPASALYGIQRFREADGSYSIYVVSTAGGAAQCQMYWSILMSNEATIFQPPLLGAPNGAPNPTGVLDFSTFDEVTYPPTFHAP